MFLTVNFLLFLSLVIVANICLFCVIYPTTTTTTTKYNPIFELFAV